MSDLGRRLRHTLDEVAPPADLDFIVAHEPSLPFWRIGRALAYAAVLVAVVGVTVVLLSRDSTDDTAVDSSVTTLEGTVTTVDDGEGPSVDDLVIPIVDPPSTEPLSGTWMKTNLGLDGLLVMPRDLIWDGDSFYLMQRVAFGDMRVWRSPNGLDWTELPSIGTFTMEEGGPEALTSYGAGLVAGGRVGDEATMWTFDGSGWTEVSLGVDAWVSDVASLGDRLVAVGTWSDGAMIPERHAHLWSSSDGLTWDEHDPSVFGEFSTAVGVVSFGGRFFAVANSWTSEADGTRDRAEPIVLASVDGAEWDPVDTKIGVASLRQVQAADVLSLSSSGSTVYITADGDSWGRILVDRSGTDPDHAVPADWWFEGRLLTLGGVERNDPRFGDVAHPMAWSYRGDGEWTEMGSGLEGMGTGLIGNGVAGNGVFVASGHGATAGSPNDGWVLYTFVADPESVAEPPESDGVWTPQVLVPQNSVCSTYVEAYPCGLLFDGDPSMVWMAPNGGADAVIEVTFEQPVEIIEMVFSPPADEEIRVRNARLSEFTVVAEGHSAVHGQLTDEPGDQRFGLDGAVTTRVTITIESAFPGLQYEGREPFVELALGEIQLLGRIAVGSPQAVAPALDTRPLTGQWFGTTPDTQGLRVNHNDLIWDGEAFYALTRLGFGDHVVWRSFDGIEWERYETIALAGELGITGVYSGPTGLLSVDGRLYAAGNANGRATVWIDDGSYPWRSVDIGPGAIRALVHHNGRFVALGDSVPPTDRPTDDAVGRNPVIWVSPDGETWGEAAGAELFGSVTFTSGLVVGPAGLLTIGFEDDGRSRNRPAGVFISEDGVSWSRHDPEFLDLTQVDSIVGWDGGYAAVGLDSRVLVSSYGIAWAPIGDRPDASMPGGFTFRSGMGVLGGRLVMMGGENFVPEGAEFNTTHPRVWSYTGEGEWAPVGDFEWFERPGGLYSAVIGGNTMVAHGETDGDNWALYTFVTDD